MNSPIPFMQRALVFDEYNGPLLVRNVPIPEIKPDEILVKIEYSGVCHSDLHAYVGDLKDICKIPLIGGHEGAGYVVRVGSQVTGWSLGDRAGVKVVNCSCLNCEFCKNGYEPLCLHVESHGLNRAGTFQEYCAIRGMDAIRIPSGIDLTLAAPIMCAGLTAYKALKESGVRPGQIVAITGAGGGLGSLGIQYANAMGMRVMAIDHGSKKEHCLQMGAEWFVDAFETPDLVKHVIYVTDGGPHGVTNFAVAKEAMELAVQYVRKSGTVVFVALPKDSKITFDTAPVVIGAVTIKGSFVGSRVDVDEAMDFGARGKVKIPLEIIKLSDVADVYRRMANITIKSRAVVDLSL